MSSTHAAVLVAESSRRFNAFAIDRLLAWSLFAGAGWAAWYWGFDQDRTGLGIGVIVGTVVFVGLVSALLLGATGLSLGKKLLGLRVVDVETGAPIGFGRALKRTVVLGLAGLPMFGLGLAILAWTAVEDGSRKRRGWHDRTSRSLVVDVRPQPEGEAAAEDRPRHVVNLTAMRLMPVREQAAAPVVPAPVRADPPIPAPAPSSAPEPTPEQPAAPASYSASYAPPAAPVPAMPQGQPQGPPQGPGPSDPFQGPPPGYGGAPGPAAPQGPPPGHAAAPPAPGGPHHDGPGQAGRHAAPPSYHWRVTFDTGESFLVEGLGLVGRQPTGRPGEQVRHLVPLTSADMSISKTHAQFHLAGDGALVVTDRGSTNGSVLIRKGVTRELSGGRPTTLVDGDRVVFGDREMLVSRETTA